MDLGGIDNITAGYSDGEWDWLSKRLEVMREKVEIPDPVRERLFVKKYENIPTLHRFNRSWWNTWVKRTYEQVLPKKADIDYEKLESECIRVGYKDKDRLDRVIQRLKKGVKIGCEGDGRLPTRVKNNKLAY